MEGASGSMALLSRSVGARGFVMRLAAPYDVLRGNRRLQILFVAHATSRVVQWLYLLALLVLVYQLTHSAQTVAELTFLRFLPNALLLPVSGALTDRWNRQLLMVISNLGRAICVLCLLAVNSRATLPLAFAVVFAATVLSSLFRPALVAMLPDVLEERRLMQANSLVVQVEMISLGLGPALGSLILMYGNVHLAFLLASLVFALAGAALVVCKLPARRLPEGALEAGLSEHLIEGYRFLAGEYGGVLLGYAAAAAGLELLTGANWTITVVLSDRVFGFGAQGAGFLNGAYGLGGVIGGVLLGYVFARKGFTELFIVMATAASVAAALYGFSPWGVLALAFNMGTGVANVLARVSAMSILQIATPRGLLGRVFGAFESTLIVAQLAGALTVGSAINAFGPRLANFAFCVAGLGLLVVCFPLLRRTRENLGARIFLRQVPALDPVSFHLLDDLATRVRLEHYGPGQSIVRQGDPGETFYIIRQGEVSVLAEANGAQPVHIATLSATDYFGEISLIKNVPRTATVVARGPVEVYGLDRGDFQELLTRAGSFRDALQGAGSARELELQNSLMSTF